MKVQTSYSKAKTERQRLQGMNFLRNSTDQYMPQRGHTRSRRLTCTPTLLTTKSKVSQACQPVSAGTNSTHNTNNCAYKGKVKPARGDNQQASKQANKGTL
jgi:hypothetical protein